MRIHSHYDNLKVSRDAPQEVIRAAYKSLAQKYHPDRNDDPQAPRILQIINAAYDVLSDPAKRAEHDSWLASQERDATEAERQAAPPRSKPPVAAPCRPGFAARVYRGIPLQLWLLIGFFTFMVAAQFVKNEQASSPRQATAAAAIDAPVGSDTPAPKGNPLVATPPPYLRPSTAPNGRAWPRQASYLAGYAVGANQGHSDITVDNTNNAFDIYAKLIINGTGGRLDVRQFFIPGGQSFKLEAVSSGFYDLHYKELNDGSTFRTDPILLQEYETDDSIHYRSVRITLFTVPGGNMRPTQIPASDF